MAQFSDFGELWNFVYERRENEFVNLFKSNIEDFREKSVGEGKSIFFNQEFIKNKRKPIA